MTAHLPASKWQWCGYIESSKGSHRYYTVVTTDEDNNLHLCLSDTEASFSGVVSLETLREGHGDSRGKRSTANTAYVDEKERLLLIKKAFPTSGTTAGDILVHRSKNGQTYVYFTTTWGAEYDQHCFDVTFLEVELQRDPARSSVFRKIFNNIGQTRKLISHSEQCCEDLQTQVDDTRTAHEVVKKANENRLDRAQLFLDVLNNYKAKYRDNIA